MCVQTSVHTQHVYSNWIMTHKDGYLNNASPCIWAVAHFTWVNAHALSYVCKHLRNLTGGKKFVFETCCLLLGWKGLCALQRQGIPLLPSYHEWSLLM